MKADSLILIWGNFWSFCSNMKDVASYSSMWYVTKRYKLFCPNTHRWDTAIYIESIDLKIKI